jgi:hypothetical protein
MSRLNPFRDAGDRGVVANERLTGFAGALLLILALAEVLTVPALRSLLSVHFVVGVLLMGPLAVKISSTGWRFLRYYTRAAAYRRKGPPGPLLRFVVAPLLLASTLMLVGSGIALAATGPAPQPLVVLHVLSFVVWLPALAAHVVAYLARVPRLVAADWRGRLGSAAVPGGRLRVGLNLVALAAGAIAALFVLPTASRWFSWLAGNTPLELVLGAGGTAGLVGAVVVGLRGSRPAASQPEDASK